MADKAHKPSTGKPRCFFISPIGDPKSPARLQSDMVLNSIIRPALPEFEVRRADEFGAPEMITDKVIEAIFTYELAIVDLTGHNPNVFYELGLRHMIEKPVIHLAHTETRLPFDTAGVGTIFFTAQDWHSHVSAREHLAKAAEQVLAKDYKVSNPVTASRASTKLAHSADANERVIARMLARMSSFEERLRSIEGEDEGRLTNLAHKWIASTSTASIGFETFKKALEAYSHDRATLDEMLRLFQKKDDRDPNKE